MTGEEAIKKLQKQYKRQNQYLKEKYDRISVTVPKGTKDWIRENTGKTVNQFFNDLLREYREKHTEEENSDFLEYPFS